MGDLLINSLSVFVLCLFLFLNYPRMGVRKLLSLSPTYRLITSIGCMAICFLAMLYPYLFVEIIYHNSSFSLEITDSIAFDGVRRAFRLCQAIFEHEGRDAVIAQPTADTISFMIHPKLAMSTAWNDDYCCPGLLAGGRDVGRDGRAMHI